MNDANTNKSDAERSVFRYWCDAMCVWDTCGSEEEFADPRLTTDCGPQNLESDTKEGDCDVVVNDTLDESNESDPSVEPVFIQRNATIQCQQIY